MEVSLLSKDTIRIKGKQASVVIDPVKTVKPTPADAILIFNNLLTHDFTKIEGSRLLITGSGEYEIGGVKVSSFVIATELTYQVIVDGVEILVIKGGSLEAAKDKAREYNMVIVLADSDFDSSHLTNFSPRVTILYGEAAEAAAKNLGKEELKKVAKYVTTREKLPEETEVVILG